jgi:peptidoglycan hydrolase-like protein with peptidoglycan-binding domain
MIVTRYGEKSSVVKDLQEKLIKLGYDVGKDGADGEFGRNTLAAVKKFQREHNLVADG